MEGDFNPFALRQLSGPKGRYRQEVKEWTVHFLLLTPKDMESQKYIIGCEDIPNVTALRQLSEPKVSAFGAIPHH